MSRSLILSEEIDEWKDAGGRRPRLKNSTDKADGKSASRTRLLLARCRRRVGEIVPSTKIEVSPTFGRGRVAVDCWRAGESLRLRISNEPGRTRSWLQRQLLMFEQCGQVTMVKVIESHRQGMLSTKASRRRSASWFQFRTSEWPWDCYIYTKIVEGWVVGL